MGACKISTHGIRKLESLVEMLSQYEIRVNHHNNYSDQEIKENEYLELIIENECLTPLEILVVNAELETRMAYDYPSLDMPEIGIEGIEKPKGKSNEFYRSYVEILQNKADIDIIRITSEKLGFTTRFVSIILEIVEMKMVLEERHQILENVLIREKSK